jgi:hypothetical protein
MIRLMTMAMDKVMDRRMNRWTDKRDAHAGLYARAKPAVSLTLIHAVLRFWRPRQR